MRILPLALCIALSLVMSACAPDYPDDRVVQSVRTLRPAVVLLTMRVPPERKSDGYDNAYASGIVVASGAWGSDILTVAHAVNGAWRIHATIDNTRKVRARVVALDKNLDVALVRTKAPNLIPARLGHSAHLDAEVGRDVGVLGYPIPDEFADEQLGLETSVNVGRLSSVRKGALEVSLPIVPGESGGPIFMTDTGEIIGIAESRFDDERSIGFALPIDDARAFLHKYDASHGF